MFPVEKSRDICMVTVMVNKPVSPATPFVKGLMIHTTRRLGPVLMASWPRVAGLAQQLPRRGTAMHLLPKTRKTAGTDSCRPTQDPVYPVSKRALQWTGYSYYALRRFPSELNDRKS